MDIARGIAPAVPLAGLVPHTSPPIDRAQVVGFPTWLWLEGWEARSVRFGPVTVTATPASARWDLVDAHTSCDGPGEAYRPGTDDGRAGARSDCSVVFTHDSRGEPDGRYHGEVTVSWALTWVAGAASGTLPNRTSNIAVAVRVVSLAAVTDERAGTQVPSSLRPVLRFFRRRGR